MRIVEARVTNFKSFADSRVLNFEQGFNLVIGQNAAGKTALLEALALRFPAVPHRSAITVPTPTSVTDAVSRVDLKVSLTNEELKELLRTTGVQVTVALPNHQNAIPELPPVNDYSRERMREIVEWFFGRETYTFQFSRMSGGSNEWTAPYPSIPLYATNMGGLHAVVRIDQKGNRTDDFGRGAYTDIGMQLAAFFAQQIYRFTAERRVSAQSQLGGMAQLSSDATNLPEALATLQANPFRFQKFNELVRVIFPQVRHVSVANRPSGVGEVLIWPIDPTTEREDLAISLSATGTGIGQALAILYVAFTSRNPTVILIDEPQSFLHPGAARKLIEVLKQFSLHQFVVATHSTEIINASLPAKITTLTLTDGASSAVQTNSGDITALKLALSSVGARLADVFGADEILWVEGATEEACFPIVVEKLIRKPLYGSAIIGVRRQGDFEMDDAERVFDVYHSVSNASLLLPVAVGFIFDEEERTAQQKADLVRESRGKLRFLPRRMYENFLLNTEAITFVLNDVDTGKPAPYDPVAIQALLDGLRADANLYPAGQIPQNWQEKVHAGKLLSRLFAQATNNRVSYDKVVHGVKLTTKICEVAPNDLVDLQTQLDSVLFAVNPQAAA